MARCGCSSGCSCALTTTDSSTIDFSSSGTGSGGNPFTITGDVKLAPPAEGGANLIENDGNGLSVSCLDVRSCFSAGDGLTYNPVTGVYAARPSTDAGNAIGFGSDGGLFAQGVAPALGCGLEVGGAGETQANVQAWPFPCPIGAAAGGIYCDPGTGELRGDPLERAMTQLNSELRMGPIVVNAGTSLCLDPAGIGSALLNINLAGLCYDYNAFFTYGYAFDVSGDTGDDWQVEVTANIDGVLQTTQIARRENTDAAGSRISGRDQRFAVARRTFAAGSVHTFRTLVCIQNNGATAVTMNNMFAYSDVLLTPEMG